MLARSKAALGRWRRKLNPHPDSWRGMARAFHVAGWVLLIVIPTMILWDAPSWYNLLALLLGVVAVLAGVAVIHYAIALTGAMLPSMRWSLTLLLAAVILPFTWLGPVFYALVGALVLSLALLGAGVASYRRLGWHWSAWGPVGVGGSGVLLLAVGVLLSGWPADEDIPWRPMQSAAIDLADPSLPGAYSIDRFTYGPGTEPRRAAYGDNVRFRTMPVDGEKLLDGWEGGAGWARSGYWEATPSTLPLRGMVWMPQGDGPFPIVLIVHGNHAMEDFSDDGYGYLGELFASRGVIAVAVDENFLNSSSSSLLSFIDGGLEEENDARGWLLLEHLRQWREWSADAGHALFAKADLDRVVLIGHSRGGEAVTEAALFNGLSAYPDDGTVVFDYHFGLRGIIAIAPVDHQYQPRRRDTVVPGVSYLVIHGSHDSDVNSYAGYAAYSRLDFAGCADCFKAGFYLLGANHGQFNTGWGRYDAPAPFGRFLNVAPLMDGEQQRQVARVMFGAFVEVVVFGNLAYRPFIAAPDRAAGLLPPATRFLSQYAAASDVVLAGFEEDADVSTGTLPGLRIRARDLLLWREAEVSLKWRTAASAMVLLGWDTTARQASPRYEVLGLTGLEPRVESDHALTFALGMSTDAPDDQQDYQVPDAIDFTIELQDQGGRVSRLPLSTRRILLPQVKPVLYKLGGLDTDPPAEVVMQRYRFTFAEFVAANPRIDVASLASLRFVFDRTPAGSLWLDDLAISPSGD